MFLECPPECRHCLKGTVKAPSSPLTLPGSGREPRREWLLEKHREMETQSRPLSWPWGQGGLWGKTLLPTESHASPLFPTSNRPALNPRSIRMCLGMNQFKSVLISAPLSPTLCHQRVQQTVPTFSVSPAQTSGCRLPAVTEWASRAAGSLTHFPATLAFLQAPLDANQGHGYSFSPVKGGVGGMDCVSD